MDYQRIHKPTPPHSSSGGGFSPVKLRNMILGLDKKRKDEDQDLETTDSTNATDTQGVGTSEQCKEVDIVSELPDLLVSGDARPKQRNRDLLEEDYDSGYDSATVSSSNGFEFHKTDQRTASRVSVAPFSKPAPSKWDDAQKWIASPTSNRGTNRTGHSQGLGGQVRRSGFFGYGNVRQLSTKVVAEVMEQRSGAWEEADTKQIDLSEATMKESGGMKLVSWAPEQYPVAESCAKPVVAETSVADSAISLSQHDSSSSVQTATTIIPPPSTVRSVCMRDMGTEMTPIASQEPSRTGTPVRATTPMRSSTSSRPSSPGKVAPVSTPVETFDFQVDTNKKELSEKEIQKRTRREIMALGAQLGKMNIAAWASKEDEEKDASTSLKIVSADQTPKNVIEPRAAAWEEAEKAKYLARFKREEIKILAWENHQKAKMEAEMRKVEVKVERMKAKAHEKFMEKLASTRHEAVEKLAAAETKRNLCAAKTEQQAEYIRRTGRLPSLSCCHWFFKM